MLSKFDHPKKTALLLRNHLLTIVQPNFNYAGKSDSGHLEISEIGCQLQSVSITNPLLSLVLDQ